MAGNKPGIHILYSFVNGPWGGGNQFLKALRDYFRRAGVHSENPGDAGVILFNSHHDLEDVLKIKRKYPGKVMIHRVDGPISYVRGSGRRIDGTIYSFNSLFADGTVFQSSWSKEKNREIGMEISPYTTIITNAPDPVMFNRKGKNAFAGGKIKLIATSWSGNVRRGFDIYQYLDNHLDFGKYEMTFVGNSPVEFKNIIRIKPLPSIELSGVLKRHDIYITASRNDPCSNALIEALHCGLPAIARNDGGHPEIVGKAGQLFESESDILQAVEEVACNYDNYQARIDLQTLDEVGQRYYDFAQGIYMDYLNGSYQPRQANFSSIIKTRVNILKWKALSKIGVAI